MIQQSHSGCVSEKKKTWIQKENSAPQCSSTEVSINRWMGKEDMVYVFSGILLSHKNETLPFAAVWMDLENVNA